MATRAHDICFPILPVQARTMQAHDSNIPAKLALADRIADLPGIEVADHDPAGVSRNVDVLLQPPVTSLRKKRQPMLLASIGCDHMVVYGLHDTDRHRVLLRGWGRPHRNGVLLCLPRDDGQLDIAWSILRRAYDAMTDASAAAVPVRAAWFDGLPRFSRTNLN